MHGRDSTGGDSNDPSLELRPEYTFDNGAVYTG